ASFKNEEVVKGIQEAAPYTALICLGGGGFIFEKESDSLLEEKDNGPQLRIKKGNENASWATRERNNKSFSPFS
ncbi:hypothetical protein VIGAN_03182900, partial [Vigna angularis var. angularis]